MAKVKLSDAPGCIGSSLIRMEQHPICSNCAFTNVCAKLAARNATRLAKELGVPELSGITGQMLAVSKGGRKTTIAEVEKQHKGGKRLLSKKGEALKSKIEKVISGEALRNAMKPDKHRVELNHSLQRLDDWVRNLILLIWDNNGQLKKSDLTECLIHDMGVKKVAASGDSAAFVNALVHLDVLKENKQKLEVIYDLSDG